MNGIFTWVKSASRTFFVGIWRHSGLAFVAAKASSQPKKDNHPTFFLWLISGYLAMFGFAYQQYESQLGRIEIRLSQIAQMSTIEKRLAANNLSKIFDTYINPEPKLYRPLSVFAPFIGRKVRFVEDTGNFHIQEFARDFYRLNKTFVCEEKYASYTNLIEINEVVKDVAIRYSKRDPNVISQPEVRIFDFDCGSGLINIIIPHSEVDNPRNLTELWQDGVSGLIVDRAIVEPFNFSGKYGLSSIVLASSYIYRSKITSNLNRKIVLRSNVLSFSTFLNSENIESVGFYNNEMQFFNFERNSPFNSEEFYFINMELEGNDLFFADLRNLNLSCDDLKKNKNTDWSLHSVQDCSGYPIFSSYEIMARKYVERMVGNEL